MSGANVGCCEIGYNTSGKRHNSWCHKTVKARERERCAKITESGMHAPNEDGGGYACACEECAVRRDIAAKIRGAR